MQDDLFTDWVSLTGDLDGLFLVPAFVSSSQTMTAVDASTESDPFELVQEVGFRIVIPIDEYPPRMLGVLGTLFQGFDHVIRQRNATGLMVFRFESNVWFGLDGVFLCTKIDIAPGCVHHFLFSASSFR